MFSYSPSTILRPPCSSLPRAASRDEVGDLSGLGKLGAEVVEASDGTEAIEACRKTPFDLVLMDMQLREMHGPEATLRLRQLEAQNALPSAKRLPLVALTAHALEEEKQECLRSGMDAVISKPIRRNDLLRGIAAALSQEETAKVG